MPNIVLDSKSVAKDFPLLNQVMNLMSYMTHMRSIPKNTSQKYIIHNTKQWGSIQRETKTSYTDLSHQIARRLNVCNQVPVCLI